MVDWPLGKRFHQPANLVLMSDRLDSLVSSLIPWTLAIGGLAFFVGIPAWIFVRDWWLADEAIAVEQIAGWVLFSLGCAAIAAIASGGNKPNNLFRNITILFLTVGLVTIVIGLAMNANTSTVDNIGPLTAAGSAFGSLLGLIKEWASADGGAADEQT